MCICCLNYEAHTIAGRRGVRDAVRSGCLSREDADDFERGDALPLFTEQLALDEVRPAPDVVVYHLQPK